MVMHFKPERLLHGVLSQSAMPKYPSVFGTFHPLGLLTRAVVINTYVSDDKKPFRNDDVTAQSNRNPVGALPESHATDTAAIYCDVMAYSTMPSARAHFHESVMVSQERGGLHEGEVWIPRPTTMSILRDLRTDLQRVDPMELDGEHVLMGFLDSDAFAPIILRGIPHPHVDVGAAPDSKDLRPKRADGGIRRLKHRGVVRDIDSDGNVTWDLTRAHNGQYDAQGREPRTPLDPANVSDTVVDASGAQGNHRIIVRSGSNIDLSVVNAAGTQRTKISVVDGTITIGTTDGTGLCDIPTQRVQVGDGAAHPVIWGDKYNVVHATLDSALADFVTAVGLAMAPLTELVAAAVPPSPLAPIGPWLIEMAKIPAAAAALIQAVGVFDAPSGPSSAAAALSPDVVVR